MVKSRGGGYLSYKELEVYKHFNGFDPQYLGHNLYLPLVARRLNDYHYTKFFEDKALLGHLSKGVEFPHCIVRCVNGEYYDDGFRQISAAQARSIVAGHKGRLVFKISRESSGGHGVKIYDNEPIAGTKPQIEKWMAEFGTNYVVQEAICQHKSMAKFNGSSVNTLRITTLYLNGKVSICSIVLRVGRSGAIVDNLCSGGVGVGVDRYGRLHDFGYDYECHQVPEINGIRFAGERLSFVPDMVKHISALHEKEFSFCKFIGWDVCVNENGNFIVVEVNSSQPGIFVGQLNNGPIFGDRTEEVIDYVAGKGFKYGKGLLNL